MQITGGDSVASSPVPRSSPRPVSSSPPRPPPHRRGRRGPRRPTWSSSRARRARRTPRRSSPTPAAPSSRTTRRSACSSRGATTRPSRTGCGRTTRSRAPPPRRSTPPGSAAPGGAEPRRSRRATCPTRPATDADTFSALQWDMRQMHTPEAHAITGGSPAVVVGDIDTGIDYNAPDLRANVSDADSADCLSGARFPVRSRRNDDNGHGTHTAGTIAAAVERHRHRRRRAEREDRRDQGRQRRLVLLPGGRRLRVHVGRRRATWT